MYKKTLTYRDFDGNERTEDLYFNLMESELLEMEMSTEGGLEKRIDAIIKAQDKKSLVKIFKSLILDTYGQKSLDGKRFIKSEELKTEFSQTEAYNKMFMLLSTDDEEAAKFINNIAPAGTPKIKFDQDTHKPIVEDNENNTISSTITPMPGKSPIGLDVLPNA